jgi:diguanylate cyclase (GGDEF)-like protein
MTSNPPTDITAPTSPARAVRDGHNAPGSFFDRIIAAFASWSRQRGVPPDPVLEEFAEVLAAATGPEAVASALARLAYRAAGPGAVRAEVWLGDARAAAWPEPTAAGRGAGTPRAWGSVPIELPLRCGGRDLGTLRVVRDIPRPLAPERHRKLMALAVLAAAAEAALTPHPTDRDGTATTVDPVHPTHDPATGLPNATFFEAFLSYALALSDRRDEPLSLFYVSVDRLTAIGKLHGPAVASEAVRRIGRTVAGALRRSDLVARLDEGRLVAVLPGASAADAARLAEHVRAAVASAGVATATMPVLTASIGAATFPVHAGDAGTLRSAAAAALAEARARGRDRVASAAPPRLAEPPSTLRIAQHAG